MPYPGQNPHGIKLKIWGTDLFHAQPRLPPLLHTCWYLIKEQILRLGPMLKLRLKEPAADAPIPLILTVVKNRFYRLRSLFRITQQLLRDRGNPYLYL